MLLDPDVVTVEAEKAERFLCGRDEIVEICAFEPKIQKSRAHGATRTSDKGGGIYLAVDTFRQKAEPDELGPDHKPGKDAEATNV